MKSRWQYQTKSHLCIGKQLKMLVEEKRAIKAKIKALSFEERVIVWHNHLNDILGNPPEITVSTISKITNRLNIETAIFTKYELLKAINTIQNRKACGLDEIPIEIWKINEFQDFY